MAGAGELRKRWEAVSARAIAAEMTFNGNCLVLGAQTRLAKVEAPVDEARLRALLAAAHGRSAPASSLRHVRRAVETWRDGEKPLALTHLALSGLAKLAQPKEDARRLFFADALIEAGVAPSNIVEGLGLGPMPASEALAKYNPDQPRVAAGNPDGGRWTSEDSVGAPTGGARQGPKGVQAADASDTRGHGIASDAAPGAPTSNSVGALGPAYRNDQPTELAQNLDQTCSAFIAANCQASILRVFPGQYLDCTLREVQAAAKEGDAAARTACKLLQRGKYRK